MLTLNKRLNAAPAMRCFAMRCFAMRCFAMQGQGLREIHRYRM